MVFEKVRQKVANVISPKSERSLETFKRLYIEAGFVPLLNMDDLEARRQDLKTTFNDEDIDKILFAPPVLQKSEEQMTVEEKLNHQRREFVRKTARRMFKLYFLAGNPYYRGLDNRELAEKVVCFLENYTDVGDLDKFLPDLLEEAMQLLSLSWQEKDVTNTPFYIVESNRPYIMGKGERPPSELDETGMLEMQAEIERMKAELEKNKK